jgi:hypothetical protein
MSAELDRSSSTIAVFKNSGAMSIGSDSSMATEPMGVEGGCTAKLVDGSSLRSLILLGADGSARSVRGGGRVGSGRSTCEKSPLEGWQASIIPIVTLPSADGSDCSAVAKGEVAFVKLDCSCMLTEARVARPSLICLVGERGVGSRVWGQTTKEGYNKSATMIPHSFEVHTGKGDGVRVASRETWSIGMSERSPKGESTGP